ncbi:Glutamate receptor ionotropic, delta-1 [Nymphon striatum]|nr:Glutamate receptor ionotropic, delta-1 [Nymphon striatum]
MCKEAHMVLVLVLAGFFNVVMLKEVEFCRPVMDISTLRHPMENFLRAMIDYTGTTSVFIISEDLCAIKSVLEIDGLWVRLISPIRSDVFEAITKEKAKPILILIFSFEIWFEIMLKKAMEDSHILDAVSFLLLTSKPLDVSFEKSLTLTPNVRFLISWTDVYEEKNKNSYNFKINVGFINTNYVSNKLQIFYLGTWTMSDGFMADLMFRNCCYNLTGFGIRVVYAKDDYPYCNVKQINNKWEFNGSAGDVFSILAKELDFSFKKVLELPPSSYGIKSTGMTHAIIMNKADIAVSGFIMTGTRLEVVSFSFEYSRDYITVLYLDHKDANFLYFYLTPFEMPTWITLSMVLIVFIILMMIFKLLHECKNEECDTALLAWGALVNQGIYGIRHCMVWRVSAYSFIIMGSLLIQLYGSKLACDNILKKYHKPFHTYGELIKHHKYTPVIINGSGELDMIQGSKDKDVAALWNVISKNPKKSILSTIDQATYMMYHQCAALIIASSIMSRFGEEIQEMYGRDRRNNHDDITSHFLLAKKSSLKRIIDNRLMDLMEAGILQKISRKYKRNNQDTKNKKKIAHSEQIEFNQISAVIFILISAITLAFLLLLLEKNGEENVGHIELLIQKSNK